MTTVELLKESQEVPRIVSMPSKKAYAVVFMVGLVLLTSIFSLQYQKINQLAAELEQLTTESDRLTTELTVELERLRIENGQLQLENEWLRESALPEMSPTVRVTNGNYNESLINSLFWGCTEWKELSNKTVVWGLENLGRFINIAAYKARVLNLNSTEILQILVNLTFPELKMTYPAIMLPCLVEKAKYEGVDAWIIVFNWEIYEPNVPIYLSLAHIRIYVVECGTQTVLHIESCL